MQRAVKSLLIQTLRTPFTTRALHYQVSFLSLPSFHSSSITSHEIFALSSLNTSNTHFKLHFSTMRKPHDHVVVTKLVSQKGWCEEIENQLNKLNLKLTDEGVLFVLKELEKSPRNSLGFFKWVCDKMALKPSSVAYNLMLRILGVKDSMKDFWWVMNKMREVGHEIDKETYPTLLGRFVKEKMVIEASSLRELFSLRQRETHTNSLLNEAIKLLVDSEWNEEVKCKLSSLGLPLSDSTILRVLEEIRVDPLKALDFYRWVGGQPNFRHSAITYNSIIRVLGRNDSVKEFWAMVKEMKESGFDMDMDSYVKLSRRFQKWNMLKEAVELYEFMSEGPYQPSVQHCGLLLRKLATSGNPGPDLVFRVVKKFEGAGNSLTKSIYDGIHRSLTSMGRFDEAQNILEAMEKAGFIPDNITYSQLIFGLCKAHRFDEACKFLDEMEALGCTPDLKTWTILIQGHCLAGEVKEALSCFKKMLGKGVEADADLLEVLVAGFCNQNRPEDAYTLLSVMMTKTHLKPWQATYKILIEGLLGRRMLEEALKLLLLMKKQKLPAFVDPFIGYISKNGMAEDAMDLLKTLTLGQNPSSAVYVNIFEAFMKEGRFTDAQDLLHRFPHHIRDFTLLAKGAAKHEEVEDKVVWITSSSGGIGEEMTSS
ncbi:pentatricopeptide repeat-containing protein At3g48250, chloroplastic isoform X2 [Amborella trichopoda]|uniref:pentatricopeptide repeat-containing protein At3g48250, chloroplastic isoform X2 n=1 Tax=Amborella trichopoda TaxID=13333 RepID=UPI0009BF6B33|nr:pentatricopeptide repeat-containing protein At3g48250, chloroplastic isoform X2 [Amborella trichopoda]|eukprot:XP_020527584.1 pentatricopeptide repeat-containing protein At3g48250, chloroplastic isoform X2 [Amborella trichopoda]